MTRHHHLSPTQRLASVGLGLLLVLCLLPATQARASYEQVATFDQSSHLRHAGGTAVNVSGAGGVPAGTVYAAIPNGSTFPPSVIRYSPQGEFRAAWGYLVGNQANEYQRCGPDGDPLYPTCAKGEGNAGEGLGQLTNPVGIAVDQTTGNVYVLDNGRQHDSVQVFSADGSKRLGGFGEKGDVGAAPVPAESIEEGPQKFHSLGILGSAIAVDGSGRVYVPENDYAESIPPRYHRVMVFEPESPGDYEHYVYSGRANDIDRESGTDHSIAAVDSAGNVYIAGDNGIHEYAAGDHHAVCGVELAAGGLNGMTVNPTNGEVFYATYKNGGSIRRMHCNAGGEFEEVEKFGPSPKHDQLRALSFNPALVYSGTRPPGVLYGVVPEVEDPLTHEFTSGRGYIFAQAEVHAPEVNSTTALEITASTATLHASINPKGAITRYRFQYISEAAYEANDPGERFAGASEAPPGGAALPAGLESVTVAAVVRGLAPESGYRYRIVAESCVAGEDPALCTTVGEARAFRTFPVESAGTPDNRVFELVSPVQKGGGEVWPARSFVFTPSCLECRPGAYSTRFPKLSSPDGERVVYDGDAFSSTEGNKNTNEYFSERTASGWQTKTLTPTLMTEGAISGHRGFSRDLGQAVFLQGEETLLPSAPAGTPNVYTQPTAAAGSLTFLLGEAAPNEGEFLDVAYAGGSTDLGHVFFSADDALTGETPVAPAPSYEFKKNNLYESFEGQLRLVNVLPGNTASALGASFGAGGDLTHVISDDGSRAFWSDASGHAYVREDGESTRAIPEPGKFLTASADGSKVLLNGGELYDLETESSVDLTAGNGGFKGIVGQSEDLSRIYFVDTAVLDGTPNGSGDSAKAGKSNLYAWHEGTVSFIASLDGVGQVEEDQNWAASPSDRTAQASPDGRWLAFQSAASLTGLDNVGRCVYIPPGKKAEFVDGPCAEAYLYDAESGELRCPSCTATGEAPRGHTRLPILDKLEPSAPPISYVNNEGRFYFDTANRLSPEDSNGVIEDVYEFEPAGIGSCERADGCVVLVSSGHGSSDANLAAVDETGKNVFFTTRDKLALKDKDALIDLYDAREGGGIAAESESLRPECQGEACQAAVSAPNDPTPSSASFHGEGNVKPESSARCSKGKRKVASKGKARCVKRKAQHQKHRNRKGAHGRTASHNRGGAK